jgi:hypothetical protein
MPPHTEGLVMRSLSLVAFVVAFGFAFISLLIIFGESRGGFLGDQICTLGVSLCDRPLLLLIPSLAALAWALMAKMID